MVKTECKGVRGLAQGNRPRLHSSTAVLGAGTSGDGYIKITTSQLRSSSEAAGGHQQWR